MLKTVHRKVLLLYQEALDRTNGNVPVGRWKKEDVSVTVCVCLCVCVTERELFQKQLLIKSHDCLIE